MIIAPETKLKYAKRDITFANQPVNFFLLNQIRPNAINNKIIPTNEMYIFSIDILIL